MAKAAKSPKKPKTYWLRLRATKEYRDAFNAYAHSRDMDFSKWARRAIEFCRDLEEAGKLNLKNDPPTVNLGDEQELVRKLLRMAREFEEPLGKP